MTTRLQARFDGKALIPTGPVDLPTGALLDLEVHDSNTQENPQFRKGSPEAILRAMAESPHVSSEDIEALNRLIEENQLPVSEGHLFDDGAK